MRFVILFAVGLLFCAIPVNAGYDYVIDEGYSGGLTLHDHETLLMTGGGVHDLTLFDNTEATILDTAPLIEHVGGVWLLMLGGYSDLDFRGGGVRQLDLNTFATATLSGGRIDEIRSYQAAYTHAGWPDPHITIISDLDSVNHDVQTNVLTGNWLDGSAFNIQLVDVDGYSPVIENIQFIPEPTSLALFGFAALLLYRRKT